MAKIEISTAERLQIILALEVAADCYDMEINRTSLRDLKRGLVKRSQVTRVIRSRLMAINETEESK